MTLERRVGALVFATLFCSYAWFFQGGGYNPNSRLALTRAVAERGTLAIDAYPVTGDWAEFGGRRFANKAPAFSLLAVPVWAALAGDASGEALSRSAWAANVATNALPAALLGWLLFHVLGELQLGGAAPRAWAALLYGLGTLAFPYATAFYAHQPAAVFGFAAFAALLGAHPSRGRALLAGAAAGLAVSLELSAALVALALGGWLLVDPRRRRLAPSYVLGGLPFALALGAYNAAAFGSPLSFWFQHANPEVEVRVSGALFGLPSALTALELLALPYRGLFFTSPVLLLGVLGWPALRRRHAAPALVCAAVPVAFLLLLSSFNAWYGGWAPGARYLVPALPFLALPLACGLARWPRLGAALGAYSVGCMLAFTAVAVEVPAGFANPLRDFALPRLLEGELSVNPQTLDAELPPDSYATGRAPRNDASFNAGELWLARGWPSLLPLLAVWGAAALALERARRAGAAIRAE